MSPLTLGRFDGISGQIDWDKLSALSNVMLGNLPRLSGAKICPLLKYIQDSIFCVFFKFFFFLIHTFLIHNIYSLEKNKHHFVASVNTFFFLNKNITKL